MKLTILPSADLKIDLGLGLHLTNKKLHKTLTGRHLMWFASPQPTVPLMNYQTFDS